ncbi:hypothetical protein FTUN_3879 [Frigoriglobus tundricola]|uniref:Uncharacterized protein n=1 Tax=Frigoriglobus tundricola TaxID=2774151 RepID=A0A6M5YTS2_9BACT|nr:hypothetical protein FTUN_3879 [Frigoriglobus tundricola]
MRARRCAHHSAASIRSANAIDTVAIEAGLKNVAFNCFLKRKPTTTAGTVPRTMSHPRRESGVEASRRARTSAHSPFSMRAMSARKYTNTAASVPSWITTVNASSGFWWSSSERAMSRCAVLLIGRNSVTPWITPSRTASQMGIPFPRSV